jgi:CRP-like cAMP-binding protein
MKTRNRLLGSLPKKDLAVLEPHFKSISFTQGDVLIDRGQRFTTVIFLESGVVSYVSLVDGGAAVESSSVGRDGVFGLIASVGPGTALRRTVVQISGEGHAIAVGKMHAAFDQSEAIRDMAMRYSTLQLSQAMQWSACNARHSVEARLARWLLTCADRTDGELLEFKHDYLAETLGVTRTSVTLAARSLQSAGLILYSRGKIQLRDIKGLVNASCECYAFFHAEIENFFPTMRKPAR